MMTEARKTGLWGEIYASRYLRRNGYEILSANYGLSGGEIDIVACKNDVVCFVEVKTRSENTFFDPAEAVDYNKQRNIRNAAAAYISRYGIDNQTRYDVVEVILTEDNYKIRHLKNVF